MSILVLPGPTNLMLYKRPDVTTINEEQKEKQDGSHPCPDQLNGRSIEPLTNLDRSNSEPDIGENIRIPIEMEVVSSRCLKTSHDSYAEEPECKNPKEDWDKKRKDL